MIKTKDWKASKEAKVLIIGENSTLQWSDEVIPYVMFLDYFFRKKPEDLGERSRFTEAMLVFELIDKLTDGWCATRELYATNLSHDILNRPPKGKKILIPEGCAKEGVERIGEILKANPSIKYVFAMGMQVNYYLQKFGFYGEEEFYIKGATPRNMGLDSEPPFYQPVNAKVFNDICGVFYKSSEFDVKVIPILPARDYPLSEQNLEKFGKTYNNIRNHFVKHFSSKKNDK